MNPGNTYTRAQSYDCFCESCARWFTAPVQNYKLCPICRAAKHSNAACGKKYVLVKCSSESRDDFANLGMIGHQNSLTIWRSLDIRGAVVRNGNDYLEWDGEDFVPCAAPHPPVKQVITRLTQQPRFVESV